MRKSVLLAFIYYATFSSISYAQVNLGSQLEQLKQAEIQIQNKQKLEEHEMLLQRNLKRIEQQKIEEKRQAERVKQERIKQAVINKEKERQKQIELKEKERIQKYEDKLKAVELEEMRLNLEAKKAYVKRTNDFIDQDLKQKSAKTDVIQSEADKTRNISSGAKSFLISSGSAQEKEAVNPIIQKDNNTQLLYLIIGIMGGLLSAIMITLIFMFFKNKK